MNKVALRVYNRDIEALIDRGQTEEAIAHCMHILKSYPKHLETYRLMGKAYLEAHHYSEAADIFMRVLLAVPDDFVAHLGMSIIYDEKHDLRAAIWHMERAFEINSTNGGIQNELRRLYGRRDGTEPARINLTRGALAQIYNKAGEFQQAIAEIKSVLADDPSRTDMKSLLAKAYFQAGMKNEAVETCTELLKLYAFSLEANRILAAILPGTSMLRELEQVKNRIIALDPYTATATAPFFNTMSVPDGAVIIERLDWIPTQQPASKNKQSPAEFPAWMQQAGIGAPSTPPAPNPVKNPDPNEVAGEAVRIPTPETNQTGADTQSGSAITQASSSTSNTPQDELPDWLKELNADNTTASSANPRLKNTTELKWSESMASLTQPNAQQTDQAEPTVNEVFEEGRVSNPPLPSGSDTQSTPANQDDKDWLNVLQQDASSISASTEISVTTGASDTNAADENILSPGMNLGLSEPQEQGDSNSDLHPTISFEAPHIDNDSIELPDWLRDLDRTEAPAPAEEFNLDWLNSEINEAPSTPAVVENAIDTPPASAADTGTPVESSVQNEFISEPAKNSDTEPEVGGGSVESKPVIQDPVMDWFSDLSAPNQAPNQSAALTSGNSKDDQSMDWFSIAPRGEKPTPPTMLESEVPSIEVTLLTETPGSIEQQVLPDLTTGSGQESAESIEKHQNADIQTWLDGLDFDSSAESVGSPALPALNDDAPSLSDQLVSDEPLQIPDNADMPAWLKDLDFDTSFNQPADSRGGETRPYSENFDEFVPDVSAILGTDIPTPDAPAVTSETVVAAETVDDTPEWLMELTPPSSTQETPDDAASNTPEIASFIATPLEPVTTPEQIEPGNPEITTNPAPELVEGTTQDLPTIGTDRNEAASWLDTLLSAVNPRSVGAGLESSPTALDPQAAGEPDPALQWLQDLTQTPLNPIVDEHVLSTAPVDTSANNPAPVLQAEETVSEPVDSQLAVNNPPTEMPQDSTSAPSTKLPLSDNSVTAIRDDSLFAETEPVLPADQPESESDIPAKNDGVKAPMLDEEAVDQVPGLQTEIEKTSSVDEANLGGNFAWLDELIQEQNKQPQDVFNPDGDETQSTAGTIPSMPESTPSATYTFDVDSTEEISPKEIPAHLQETRPMKIPRFPATNGGEKEPAQSNDVSKPETPAIPLQVEAAMQQDSLNGPEGDSQPQSEFPGEAESTPSSNTDDAPQEAERASAPQEPAPISDQFELDAGIFDWLGDLSKPQENTVSVEHAEEHAERAFPDAPEISMDWIKGISHNAPEADAVNRDPNNQTAEPSLWESLTAPAAYSSPQLNPADSEATDSSATAEDSDADQTEPETMTHTPWESASLEADELKPAPAAPGSTQEEIAAWLAKLTSEKNELEPGLLPWEVTDEEPQITDPTASTPDMPAGKDTAEWLASLGPESEPQYFSPLPWVPTPIEPAETVAPSEPEQPLDETSDFYASLEATFKLQPAEPNAWGDEPAPEQASDAAEPDSSPDDPQDQPSTDEETISAEQAEVDPQPQPETAAEPEIVINTVIDNSPNETDSPSQQEAEAEPAMEAIPAQSAADLDRQILEKARELLIRGRLDDAAAEYSILIKDEKLLEEIIVDLQQAVTRHSVDIITWQTLGDAYFRGNRIQEALDAYGKAEGLLH